MNGKFKSQPLIWVRPFGDIKNMENTPPANNNNQPPSSDELLQMPTSNLFNPPFWNETHQSPGINPGGFLQNMSITQPNCNSTNQLCNNATSYNTGQDIRNTLKEHVTLHNALQGTYHSNVQSLLPTYEQSVGTTAINHMTTPEVVPVPSAHISLKDLNTPNASRPNYTGVAKVKPTQGQYMGDSTVRVPGNQPSEFITTSFTGTNYRPILPRVIQQCPDNHPTKQDVVSTVRPLTSLNRPAQPQGTHKLPIPALPSQPFRARSNVPSPQVSADASARVPQGQSLIYLQPAAVSVSTPTYVSPQVQQLSVPLTSPRQGNYVIEQPSVPVSTQGLGNYLMPQASLNLHGQVNCVIPQTSVPVSIHTHVSSQVQQTSVPLTSQGQRHILIQQPSVPVTSQGQVNMFQQILQTSTQQHQPFQQVPQPTGPSISQAVNQPNSSFQGSNTQITNVTSFIQKENNNMAYPYAIIVPQVPPATTLPVQSTKNVVEETTNNNHKAMQSIAPYPKQLLQAVQPIVPYPNQLPQAVNENSSKPISQPTRAENIKVKVTSAIKLNGNNVHKSYARNSSTSKPISRPKNVKRTSPSVKKPFVNKVWDEDLRKSLSNASAPKPSGFDTYVPKPKSKRKKSSESADGNPKPKLGPSNKNTDSNPKQRTSDKDGTNLKPRPKHRKSSEDCTKYEKRLNPKKINPSKDLPCTNSEQANRSHSTSGDGEVNQESPSKTSDSDNQRRSSLYKEYTSIDEKQNQVNTSKIIALDIKRQGNLDSESSIPEQSEQTSSSGDDSEPEQRVGDSLINDPKLSYCAVRLNRLTKAQINRAQRGEQIDRTNEKQAQVQTEIPAQQPGNVLHVTNLCSLTSKETRLRPRRKEAPIITILDDDSPPAENPSTATTVNSSVRPVTAALLGSQPKPSTSEAEIVIQTTLIPQSNHSVVPSISVPAPLAKPEPGPSSVSSKNPDLPSSSWFYFNKKKRRNVVQPPHSSPKTLPLPQSSPVQPCRPSPVESRPQKPSPSLPDLTCKNCKVKVDSGDQLWINRASSDAWCSACIARKAVPPVTTQPLRRLISDVLHDILLVTTLSSDSECHETEEMLHSLERSVRSINKGPVKRSYARKRTRRRTEIVSSPPQRSNTPSPDPPIPKRKRIKILFSSDSEGP